MTTPNEAPAAPSKAAHTPGHEFRIESLRPERQDGIDLPVCSIKNESGHVAMIAPYFDGFRWSAKYYNVLWANGKVEKCQSVEAAIARATGEQA